MYQIIEKHQPSQSHWELATLLEIVEPYEPSYILEIGVHRGGSLKVWRDVFLPKMLIGIDGQILPEARVERAHLVEGYSQSEKVYQEVVSILGDKKLDFLFIDGGHLYQEVKNDFEVYSPLVREGGIVGFHDVIVKENDIVEVYRLWEELKKKYKTITIWDGTASGTGEGLVFL